MQSSMNTIKPVLLNKIGKMKLKLICLFNVTVYFRIVRYESWKGTIYVYLFFRIIFFNSRLWTKVTLVFLSYEWASNKLIVTVFSAMTNEVVKKKWTFIDFERFQLLLGVRPVQGQWDSWIFCGTPSEIHWLLQIRPGPAIFVNQSQ